MSKQTHVSPSSTTSVYTPDWSSLRRHPMPGWLDGMKFGIYCHWGPQTIQLASDEDISYVDAIDRWTGEAFSAEEWADLFQTAGAQFAGPVAMHGGGMLNWNSRLTDWNSVKRGPKRDILGELAAAIRKRGMKLMASFHSCGEDGVWGPMSSADPVYLDPRTDRSEHILGPAGRMRPEYLEGWRERICEAIDAYRPDLIWFDTSFGGTVGGELRGGFDQGRLIEGADNAVSGIDERYQLRVAAHYFNKALEWGKEVELVYKSFDIPPGIGMRDIENGNLTGLQYDPWMADINIVHHYKYPHTWFYNPANPMKDANCLVDMLVDITSKNGRLLLSVPPLPDGSITPEMTDALKEIGKWLAVNGEAIYGTIPWVFYGEGPTVIKHPGHHGQGKLKGREMAAFGERDVRFTQKGTTLYAICLGWPGKELAVRALGHAGKLHPGVIQSVRLLGHDGEVAWEQTAEALVVRFPETKPCDYAYCLKVERQS